MLYENYYPLISLWFILNMLLPSFSYRLITPSVQELMQQRCQDMINSLTKTVQENLMVRQQMWRKTSMSSLPWLGNPGCPRHASLCKCHRTHMIGKKIKMNQGPQTKSSRFSGKETFHQQSISQRVCDARTWWSCRFTCYAHSIARALTRRNSRLGLAQDVLPLGWLFERKCGMSQFSCMVYGMNCHTASDLWVSTNSRSRFFSFKKSMSPGTFLRLKIPIVLLSAPNPPIQVPWPCIMRVKRLLSTASAAFGDAFNTLSEGGGGQPPGEREHLSNALKAIEAESVRYKQQVRLGGWNWNHRLRFGHRKMGQVL